MNLIDTHCHFEIENEEKFLKELKQIEDQGVLKIIVSCCTKEEQRKNIPILSTKENIFLALGYHPEEVEDIQEEDLKNLEEMIKRYRNVVAIGEIGLDYHYTKENKEKQKQLFEKQLSLAQKLSLPVVIHSRDATLDTIECLKKYPVKGVIHCFSGSLETAQIYIKMGFLLGIGGIVTFKNSHLQEVIKEIPLEKIVLETDSPYLAPVPHRGERNTPAYIPIIAQRISEIKNISQEEVDNVTTETANSLFHLT